VKRRQVGLVVITSVARWVASSPPDHLTPKQKKIWRRNMGYRSDMLIAVAFKNKAQRDEVLAVYVMDQRVTDNNLAPARWKNYDAGEYPVLYFEAEDVKWYDNDDDVQGIEHLIDVASNFAQERGHPFASLYYRIGEELNDIETTEKKADPSGEMLSFLFDMCGIKRRLTHNFG